MLKKKEVLRHLPRLSAIKKKVTANRKTINKLIDEVATLESITDSLDGIILHDGFPLRQTKYYGCIEFTSGCSDVRRSAYIKPVGSTRKYVVTTYNNDGKDNNDGTPVVGEYSRVKAAKIAKDFVSTGLLARRVQPAID